MNGRELLIGVTSFFRDPEAFAALCEGALPELLATIEAAGGDRRRAIEALAQGKALALTPEVATPLGLRDQREAVVSGDPEKLAEGIRNFVADQRKLERLLRDFSD